MNIEELKLRGFEDELNFSASRSSGAGGQNVNKVNTKVELRFDILASQYLSDEEKALIIQKLTSQLTNENILLISSQETRSQLQNKELVIEKFYQLISKALTQRKKRKPTAPSATSKEKRLQSKKKTSEKKELRKRIE
jgi:ribosome-associated protein